MRISRSRLALFIAASLLAVPPDAVPRSAEEKAPPASLRRERPGAEGILRVHFIDVGQGDATLIQCPDASNILIDGGPAGAISYLIPYLRKAGVERLDMVIATHPDGDHIGGLPAVIENIPVAMVLDPGKSHSTDNYREFLEAVKGSPRTRYALARAGQLYTFGKVRLRILNPRGRLPKNNNDASIICRLTYGSISFLFPGDAEQKAERAALRTAFPLRSTVLKIGHHGSKTSTGRAFLSAVSPRAAVISCGAGNAYGHPHPSVMRSLKSRGVRIYRTDEQGTILFECSRKGYRVRKLGKPDYPDYDIPREHEGKLVGNRWRKIYHLPGGDYYRKVPPEARVYFRTESEAAAAGYRKSYR